ncbi:MAG: DUF1015 domain-containing protein [Clostridia bacterium]|nr:DUF1015 domain-containing protein [Clostridia bacterium]
MAVFNKADILLPKTDMEKWSVVACDQFTSQPEYWAETERIAGDTPSTLNLVFPEVYLSEGRGRIEKINKTMQEYLDSGLFAEYKNSLIYIERTVAGKVRQGLVGAVDLDAYDFHKGAKSAIRATEGTVMERIPPRVEIRRDAPLELPHVMLLVDDSERTIIEPLKNSEKTPLYDFDLMQKGGHLSGWLLSDSAADSALNAIAKLEKTAPDGLLFAVGDGNHSLATAKTCWEKIKKTLSLEEQINHPARFCLVELVNIHSEALVFEPIHRVVFGCDAEKLVAKLKSECGGEGYIVKCVTSNGEEEISLSADLSKLAVGVLQNFLDKEGVEVDYIHGDDVCRELGKRAENVGFLLPKPDKSDLFKSVIKDGALPRKTFSMGDANEKRYYTEAKRIK